MITDEQYLEEYIEDEPLESLLAYGKSYVAGVEKYAKNGRNGEISEDERLFIDDNKRLLRNCEILCKLYDDDDASSQEATLNSLGLTLEDIEAGTHILETAVQFRDFTQLVEYMNKLDYPARSLIMTYMNYFPASDEVGNNKRRTSMCMYLQRCSQSEVDLAQENLRKILENKRAMYTRQGLDSSFLDKYDDIELYGCFSMFNPRGTSGNASFYPKSSVLYIVHGKSYDSYAETAVHERTHQIVDDAHNRGFVYTTREARDSYYLRSFNFNEVLVDLLANIEDPTTSRTDYSRGMGHLAHILEMSSIKRHGEEGSTAWKAFCLGLFSNGRKADVYSEIQKWYDEAIPDGYGNFIEEMLVYTDKSIRNRSTRCSSFVEACSKWSWLKLGLAREVEIDILEKIYNKMGEDAVFDTEAYLLDIGKTSIRTFLDSASS